MENVKLIPIDYQVNWWNNFNYNHYMNIIKVRKSAISHDLNAYSKPKITIGDKIIIFENQQPISSNYIGEVGKVVKIVGNDALVKVNDILLVYPIDIKLLNHKLN